MSSAGSVILLIMCWPDLFAIYAVIEKISKNATSYGQIGTLIKLRGRYSPLE